MRVGRMRAISVGRRSYSDAAVVSALLAAGLRSEARWFSEATVTDSLLLEKLRDQAEAELLLRPIDDDGGWDEAAALAAAAKMLYVLLGPGPLMPCAAPGNLLRPSLLAERRA